MVNNEITLETLSISEVHQRLLDREITFSELTQRVIERIKEQEQSVNGFISLFFDEALNQAQELDKRFKKSGDNFHPLTGIPIAIKDNILVKDKLTTCGSKILSNFIAPYDATVVKRLKEVNSIIIGKTNLDEFAMGSSTETSYFGPAVNPLDQSRVPGGSSGGSAAVVRYGGAFGALGSDTGGSIRQPAAFCGVVGLKPTYGRVSRYGLVAFASSLDQIGPIARTVKDCALIFSVIAGYDPSDSTSVNPAPFWRQSAQLGMNPSERCLGDMLELDKPIKDLRIGIPKEYFESEGLEKSVRDRIDNMINGLRPFCAEIKEISLPHTPYAIATYHLICTAEASSNLARYDGVRYGLRKSGKDVRELYANTREDGFGQEVKRRILLGTYGLSKGYYDEYYGTAQKARTLIKEDFDQAFSKVDVIITPTTPTTAFRLGEKITDPLAMYLQDVFTVPINLAGLPAISIPCPTQGLPVGLQIIGRPFDELTILRVAHRMEEIKN